jgi:hypothetical protein
LYEVTSLCSCSVFSLREPVRDTAVALLACALCALLC